MQNRKYMRGNIYMLFGAIMLYLVFKMFTDRSEVIGDAPVLPWVFMAVFGIAGIGMLLYGGSIMREYTKLMKEAAEKAKLEEQESTELDESFYDDYSAPQAEEADEK